MGFAASETVNVGVVGCGGRARHLLKALGQIEGLRAAALCDVFAPALDETAPLADKKATRTGRSDDILGEAKLDAVLIATPDHWHAPLTLAAMKAGKDVYVEKPLTHRAEEGALLLAAAKSTKQIVQVGTQHRSMPHLAEARELVKAGKLGRVVQAEMTWNRNSDRVRRGQPRLDPKLVDWKQFLGSAPAQEFDEYRFRNWRWFTDFGGGIFTDLMVHWVDTAHWLLDLPGSAASAVSSGCFQTAKDVWQTPDTVQTILTYPNELQMHFAGTFSNARGGAHLTLRGTEASLYVDRGRYELTPERRSKLAPLSRIEGTGAPGADFYDKPDGERLHLENWLACVRSRKQPSAPIEAGVRAADSAHLANAALARR